jgi:hypothetical protein
MDNLASYEPDSLPVVVKFLLQTGGTLIIFPSLVTQVSGFIVIDIAW